jgi:hypothetical protein
MKKHPDQELIIIKQKLFLLALSAIENQNLIKISWIKENVKTLGVHHGYNVANDQIWKDIIDRMKNCIQVWKSRKLSYKGKTIIVKNLLLSYCGFEIEMKGIPDIFKKKLKH